MSIIIYNKGVLVGDRNCQAWLNGTLTSLGEMKKIWVSECNTVALAWVGDQRSESRTKLVLSFLVGILRRHELENQDMAFKGSLVVDLNPLIDLERNSIIVMTHDSAYCVMDQQLVEIGDDSFHAHGTGASRALVGLMNGFTAEQSIYLALKTMSVSDRTYDMVRQDSLSPMVTQIEQVEELLCSLSN